MKLVNRLSVYFLAALALVLVVYSSAFYAIVRGRLVQQFELELTGTLQSLVASVEVEPEEVKWQPLEHLIPVTGVGADDDVQWAVIGDEATIVGQSAGMTPTLLSRILEHAGQPDQADARPRRVELGQWHVLLQRLVAPAPDRSQRELDEFDEIVVVAAHSTVQLHHNLDRLLALVCLLPLATWGGAAGAGLWMCRRALQPVVDMAQKAKSMVGTNLHSRLPVSRANDELSDLARAFNTVLDRQQRAFEQQRRFTSAAAHELKTPLTGLLGQIDVTLRRSRSPEEYAATLAKLRQGTVDLQEIVESLLFLARAEEDAVLPDRQVVSLTQWLPEYLDHWDAHPRSNDLQLRIQASPPCPVAVSPSLLPRLLDNLVENAMKYSPAGTPVLLQLESAEGQVELSVTDRGSGIAPEELPDIFTPFYRCQAARDTGVAGTGLGLAIAARIARAMGGELTCTSQPGRGSRFVLRLALADDAPGSVGRGSLPRGSDGHSPAGNSRPCGV